MLPTRPAMFLPLSLLLWTACVDRSHPVSLDQIARPFFAIDVGQNGAEIQLGSRDCVTFPGNAFMNGWPLQQLEVGGPLRNDLYAGCAEPTWKIPSPLADEQVTKFEIADSTGRLTFGVRHLGARRALGDPSRTPDLRWGEPASIPWYPGTDEFRLNSSIVLVSGGRKFELARPLEGLMVRDGEIRFRMPPAPPDGGPATIQDGQLVAEVDQVVATSDHCEPTPDGCRADVFLVELLPSTSFTVPVTVH